MTDVAATQIKQPFEKFEKLTHWLRQLALADKTISCRDWNDFLAELNGVCEFASSNSVTLQQYVDFADWIPANGFVAYPGYPHRWADLNTEGRVVSTSLLYALYVQSTKPLNS
jgi:hypothetical protein